MRCVVCKHGEVAPGEATVTLERGRKVVVVRRVPARVCANCGEEYIDEEAAGRTLEMFEDVVDGGIEVEVRDYVAA